MLSLADRQLVERDRAIPGLGTLLDPAAFVSQLAEVLPDLANAHVSIPYLRYKPGANCLARFELEMDGRILQGYAKAYGRDASTKFTKAVQRATVRSPVGPGRVLLAESAIEVAFFPNDSKLKALHQLMDEATGEALLAKLLPRDSSYARSALKQLNYKPERRFVARLDLDGRPFASLKLYAEREFRRARHNALAVKSGSVLRLPKQLRASRGYHAQLLEWLPGTPLQQIISAPELDQLRVQSVGAALAELHNQRGEHLARQSVLDIGKSVRSATTGMHITCPALEPLLSEVEGRIVRSIASEQADMVPIHGDFYASQVLVDGERVAIIDLDNAARGNPASDLGLFIAHLERNAVTGGRPKAPVTPVREALLAGYETVRRLPASGSIDLHTAVGLVQLAPHHFRNREPEWEQRTSVTLNRALELLDNGSHLSIHPAEQAAPAGVVL